MVTKSFSNSAACASSNVFAVFKVFVAALGGACLKNLPSFTVVSFSIVVPLEKNTGFIRVLLALNAIEKDTAIYKLFWPLSP